MTESDVPQGWRYLVEITRDDGAVSEHRVRLGWVDHNHWTGERAVPPWHVAEAVVRYLLDHMPDELPARFDAAIARRWVPAIDRELVSYFGPEGREIETR